LHDPKGASGFAKEAEDQTHRTPHFSVRVPDGLALFVVAKTDCKGEAQFAFLGFVELSALEARVQKMELGLGHCTLQSEPKSVVEIRRIVASALPISPLYRSP
jgi:hypothetical protein